MDDRNLVYLPAVGFVAADADFDAAQRHRVRRRSFSLADIVDDAVAVVVETVGALVRAMRIADLLVLIEPIVFIVVRPGIERGDRWWISTKVRNATAISDGPGNKMDPKLGCYSTSTNLNWSDPK